MKRFLLLLLLWSVPGIPARAQSSLDLSAVEALARPDAELTEDLRRLSEAKLLVATSRSFLRESLSLSFEGGPRHSGSATSSDLVAALEVPITLDRKPARRFSAALSSAESLIEVAARLEARDRMRAAYAESWLASERVRLLTEQVRLGEEWLRVTRRRIEAGTAAPYESALVEGDILRTRAERDRAVTANEIAWGTLRSRARVPDSPVPLVPPAITWPRNLEEGRGASEESVLLKALDARRTLASTSVELDRSLMRERWSLTATAGKEGEESLARVGLSYRFSLPGEAPARDAVLTAGLELEDLRRNASRAALEARLAAATKRAESFGEIPDAALFKKAIEAVSLRLAEGKEPPVSAILLRRQLVEATLLALERRRDAFLLTIEIETLTRKEIP